MSAANSLYQRLGGTSFPLAPSSTLPGGSRADLLEADPAADILLDLLAAAITAELEPRWASVANETKLHNKRPVEQKLPELADLEALRQTSVAFPLLAVERNESPVAVEPYDLEQVKETWRWDVDYILGPLALGSASKLRPVLRAVARAMVLTIREGGHLAYAVAGDGIYPKSVFGKGDGCCDFSSIRVVEYRVGVAQASADGPKFHAASMTLETVELSAPVAGGIPSLGTYQGTSVTLRSGTEQGLKTLVTADSANPLPE